jgi:hypothetical protein
MRRAFFALFAFVPGLHAQAARPSDAVVVSPSVAVAAPRFTGRVRNHRTIFGSDEARLASGFGGSRAPGQPFRNEFVARFAFDSARAPQHGGHAVLGAVLGLGIGAGAGYVVAISRVRAIERGQHDGPFQQLDYLMDPVIGGLIGSIVGGLVGSHVR